MNDEGIANLKRDISPGAFRVQYELRRGDDSSATFKRTWWRWYYQRSADAHATRPPFTDHETKAVEMPAAFARFVITADFTFGSVDGDFAVVQAWGESGPNMYLVRQRRGRVGYETSLSWIEEFAEEFPGATIGIEKAAHGVAVLEKVKSTIRGVKALKPWGKKTQRHAAATPTARDGYCYLPLGAVFEEVDEEGTVELADATEFIEEHAGATNHDDQMDASSYAILEIVGVGGHRRTAGPQSGQEISEAGASNQVAAHGLDSEEIKNLAALL